MKATWSTEDGSVRLFNADCLPLLAGMEGVDVVVTDIPYNCSQGSGGLRTLDYGEWDHAFDWQAVLPAFVRLSRSAAVWCHEKQLSGILSHMEQAGWIDRPLAWVKTNPTVINGQHIWLPGIESCAFGKQRGAKFNAHCHPGYWFCPPDRERLHPNQKPQQVIIAQVLAMTDVDEVVLDPFMGSGTTGVACVRTGRRFIGVEKERRYFDIAVKRIEAELSRHPLFEPVEQQRGLFG